MSKNNRYTRRSDHDLRYIENHLRRKTDRQRPQRSHPLDEAKGANRIGSFEPTPSTAVISVPIVSRDSVMQAGLLYQDGNIGNLTFRAGAGPNGEDVLRVNGNNQGLQKTNSATLMLHDAGMFSVLMKGFNGGTSSAGDEYVLAVSDNDGNELMVVRWEYDGGATPVHVLRMYPDLTNHATTYVELELDESNWQDEDWHELGITWSYKDQKWNMWWDETDGTLTYGETVPWPDFEESTRVDIFTDSSGENDIFHDVCFMNFSVALDLKEWAHYLRKVVTCTNDDLSGLTNDVTGNPISCPSTVVEVDGYIVYIS